MKLPRVRFTVRWMMIVVAASAGLLVIGEHAQRLWKIVHDRRQMAARLSVAEIRQRALAATLRQQSISARATSIRPLDVQKLTGGLVKDEELPLARQATRILLQAEEIAKSKSAYERAAYRPWDEVRSRKREQQGTPFMHLMPPKVVELAWSDPYILAKQRPPKDPRHSEFAEPGRFNYWIINMRGPTVSGPFTTGEFQAKRAGLGIDRGLELKPVDQFGTR